jgi:nucleotide-binding universal stress UspA family protein
MRILLVANGTRETEAVLHLGSQLLRRAGEPPTVLTVSKARVLGSPQPADTRLAHACEFLQPVAGEVKTKVRVGRPAEQILREAREGNFDLMIMGERPHHNAVAGSLPGHVTMRVIEQAPCPVLVAKGRLGTIRRILLCDSGVECPSLLSRFTTQLADLLDGEEQVTVLHVMSQISAGPGVAGKQLRASAAELIDERTPEGELLVQDLRVLERPGVHLHPEVRHGLVVDEILAEARAGDYDLVVIGAHRGRAWQRLLLADLAQEIVHHLDRPVLVVR